MELKYRILLFASAILVGLGLIFTGQSLSFSRFRLVFCNVGQGDAILMISGAKQILIDGGPGTKIVDCLGAKMPFWDRTIELVVLTHPQRDHLEGLLEVLARYKVEMIATTGVKNQTELFAAWEKTVANEGAKIYTPKAGERIQVDRVSFDVLWPSLERLNVWQKESPKDLNESSIVLRVQMKEFCAYLTGDLPKEKLELALQGEALRGCEVLKISHHGSKTGTNEQILDRAKPSIAIIQVGRNSFGHPHKEVIDLLTSKGIKIYRNDLNGNIEVVSDGRGFEVQTDR